MRTVGERLIEAELKRYGLRAERFSKQEQRKGKTPDFKVYHGVELAFYCEVKDITDTDPLFDHAVPVAAGISVAEQLRQGAIAEKGIIWKMKDAVKQFSAIDPAHKQRRVLAFVNLYDLAFVDTLRELLVGYQQTQSGHKFVTTSPEGRTEVARLAEEFDMFWWFEKHDFEPVDIRLGWEGSEELAYLRSIFNLRERP
jgi:hypothetical protein